MCFYEFRTQISFLQYGINLLMPRWSTILNINGIIAGQQTSIKQNKPYDEYLVQSSGLKMWSGRLPTDTSFSHVTPSVSYCGMQTRYWVTNSAIWDYTTVVAT
jgi:hypothetical protein